jgi:hypothetical protein
MMYMRLVLMHARDAIAQQQIERELCFLKDHLTCEQGYQCAYALSQDDGLMVTCRSTSASGSAQPQ